MGILRCLTVLGCLAALAGSAPAQDAAAAPLDPQQVEAAIRKGATWLAPASVQGLGQQQPYPRGRAALAAFALLRAGADPRQVEPHFEWLGKGAPEGTYSEALYILALEAVAIRPKLDGDATRTYERRKLPPAARERIAGALTWLLQVRNPGQGRWGYTKGQPAQYDNSNTQFAVYALHSAESVGLRVPDEVWAEVLQHLLTDQERAAGAPALALARTRLASSGLPGAARQGTRSRSPATGPSAPRWLEGQASARGWPYVGGSPATPTMTPAGLGSMAMTLEAIGRRRKGAPGKLEEQGAAALRDGLAWLASKWDSSTLSSTQGGVAGGVALNLYEYYAVEKALDALGVVELEGRSWWDEAARHLLAAQNENGSWGAAESEYSVQGPAGKDRDGNALATSFALLFLSRATLPADGSPPPKAGPARPRTGD